MLSVFDGVHHGDDDRLDCGTVLGSSPLIMVMMTPVMMFVMMAKPQEGAVIAFMFPRVNSTLKRGSDVAAARRRKSVPGGTSTRDLAPIMDAESNLPRKGQSRNGGQSNRDKNAKVGLRLPESLVERYDSVAYRLSEPGDHVSRSELFREALFSYIDDIEDELVEEGGDP